MENWKKRSIDLLTSLAFGGDDDLSVIPYYPQKTEISSYEYKYFNRATPEKHGISSKRLYNMLCELEVERRANIHSLMVLRGGEVILECSRDGYDVNIAKLSHSMSKSVTGMAIGMLYDEGKLSTDMKVADFFPDIKYRYKRFGDMTVDHLLSMTSGISFSEAGSVTEQEWLKTFFASAMKFAPGAKFSYNSMNSYILGRIVAKVSGQSLTEFLDERLFAPLGITNYFWEIGPEGVEKGGWGLYLSPESWAKIGMMVLHRGEFYGKRILSTEWIDKSTATQAVTPEINGDFNYGYQIWVGRNTDEVLFNGMLGQNVWMCPQNDMVAVIMSGNNELFQDSPALEILRKYLGTEISDSISKRDAKILAEKESRFFDSRRWVRPLHRRRGLAYWLGVRSRTAFDERWNELLGTYDFAKNHTGILPLIVRGMQNNLASRIESVSFERRGERLFMTVKESGESYRIEIGLYDYQETVLDFRGEKYIVKAMGEAPSDEYGDFRIELLFPELPNTRMISVYRPDDDRISMTFSEVPNNKIVEALIDRVTSNPAISLALQLLERQYGEDFIHKKVESTFTPELIGADTTSEDYSEIIKEEADRAQSKSKMVKLLVSAVDRIFKIEENPPAEKGINIFEKINQFIKGRQKEATPEKEQNEDG